MPHRDRAVEIFWVRWVSRLPVSEWWTGAAVGSVLIALTYLIWIVSQRTTDPGAFLDRLPYVVAAGIGYLVAAVPYGIRKARGDLEDLRPHLHCSAEELAAAEARLSRQDWRLLVLALVASIAIPAAIQELMAERAHRLVRGPALDAWEVWSLFMPVLLWFAVFSAVLVGLTQMRTMRSMGLHHVELRLFDREAARPLVRFGLRLATIAVVAPLVLVALALVANAVYPPVALSTYVLGAGVATLEVLAPLSGLRRRILAAKQKELVRVERAIREHHTALGESPRVDESGTSRVVDLLAYRREVEAIPSWPLDAPALRRFALYLLLPLASWVAGALVERLVDRLLQRGL
jgi:hypothetical protein